MLKDTPPPPRATYRTGIFEDLFAKTAGQIALVQVRNGLKALTGAPCPTPLGPVSPELLAQHIEANLQIIERALGGRSSEPQADPRQIGLFQ